MESMKKMWTQLQLMGDAAVTPRVPVGEEDDVDLVDALVRSRSVSTNRPNQDGVDHVASTTELISTLKSRQNVPNKDVQKEAMILRNHWSKLVQRYFFLMSYSDFLQKCLI